MLDLIDDVAAGIECLAAVRRADADPDRELTDRQRSDAVRTARTLDTEALSLENCCEQLFRHLSQRFI